MNVNNIRILINTDTQAEALLLFLVLHLFRQFGQQDNSRQKYTLAYFLLVRHEYFSMEPRKHSAGNVQHVRCCDSSVFSSKELELKKQNDGEDQSGCDSSANGSNNCLLQDLHDDSA